MEFYSGATALPGRFTEGFLHRRLQSSGAAQEMHLIAPCGDSQNQGERQNSNLGEMQSGLCADGRWARQDGQTNEPHRRTGESIVAFSGQRFRSERGSAGWILASVTLAELSSIFSKFDF